MKSSTPFIMMSLLALLLVMMLTAFINTPNIIQDSNQLTETAIYARASEIIYQATLTAQAGGDITQFSGGTSTPLAGVCNSLLYRRLDDVRLDIEHALALITSMPPNFTVETLLLEETTDCITFTRQELTITITVPVPTLDELNDENRLGVHLGRILLSLFASTPMDGLSNPVVAIVFKYGNQSRTFSAQWRDVRDIGGAGIGARGTDGAEAIRLFSLAGIEGE